MVYVAVLSYFSVAFMGLSTLPAWLQSCVIAENPDATPDEVAVIYGARYSAFTFVQGTVIALVAGWAGALSDRFGRRRCAALPAIGQAAGSAVLALTAYYELDWRVGLAGWTVSGALGGPLVFLAAAFAYMADWTPQERRGWTFAGLEGSMLYVRPALQPHVTHPSTRRPQAATPTPAGECDRSAALLSSGAAVGSARCDGDAPLGRGLCGAVGHLRGRVRRVPRVLRARTALTTGAPPPAPPLPLARPEPSP